MLIPVYAIVAIINIFAKSQNFSFRPSKDLPYEIRVKRDLINTLKYVKNNPDGKTEEKLNGLEVEKETINENTSKHFMNHLRIAVTEAEFKNDNIVTDDSEHEYKKLAIPLTIKHVGLHDKIIPITNQNRGNVKGIDNSENDYLLPKQIETWKKFKEVIEKYQRSNKHRTLADNPKIALTHHLNLQDGDKRTKRNIGSDSNNQYNNNYMNQNGYNDNYDHSTNNDVAVNNMDNYHVTEKTTLNRVIDWVKNLINPREKYVITNITESFQTNYSSPLTENKSREITTITPKYSWNYGNDNNIYNARIQNSDTATPSYIGYNYNVQQSPYYGASNNALENKHSYEAGVNPISNGIKIYNNQQQYPYYNNGNKPQNTYNGLQPLNKNTENNISSYNTNNYDYGYNGINGTRHNQTVFDNNDYGFNPFPVNNITDATESTAVENITVSESCILCGSFGCPFSTRRVGFRCIPKK